MPDKLEASDLLFFNGINAATGDYGLPPMSGRELAEFLRGEKPPENLRELRYRHEQGRQRHYGVREGVDPKKLDEAGWGVIFHHGADAAVKEALGPLLELRKQQAGERLFRIYDGAGALRPGEAKSAFLARHGVGPGPADPEKVPYYLLIVGSPEQIPFRFQSQLDVQYAVGRLHFDSAEDYAAYAESVVAAERGGSRLPRRASFFGVENPDDRATGLSLEHLIRPVHRHLEGAAGDWRVDAVLGDEATKAKLARLLGGEDTPSLLMTASHGLELELGDPRQLAHQGALLCQDWPGPKAWNGRGRIPQDFFLAGEDLSARAALHGLICFSFACYGAGTPRHDEFAKQAFKDHRRQIAPHAFLGALPKKMLAHPRGGALAFVGHVERAWGYSFLWQGAGAQTAVFESTFDRLLAGHTVGSACEFFDERYAELSTMLADQLEEADFGVEVDPYVLAGLWTANNDARGYMILGDPAVRLPSPAKDRGGEKLRGRRSSGRSYSAEPKEGFAGASLRESAEPLSKGDEPQILAPAKEPDEKSAKPSPAKPPKPPKPPKEDVGPDFALAVEAEPDEVHFSAYHPRAVAVDEPQPLLLYAHLQQVREAIERDSGQVLGLASGDYRRAEGRGAASVEAGTEITVVPEGEGLIFEPPRASLVWDEQWQRVRFAMRATAQRAGHVAHGALACYVGPLMVAEVPLAVVVKGDPGEIEAGEQATVASTAMYRSIFASYSHDDTPIVEALEKAYKALGMDYLRDVMTLRSGQQWSDELLAMIERADVMQLFWSETASRSAYVEQEWRHALTLVDVKGPAFIRPIYWQSPLAPVPRALSHIHFARVELGSLGFQLVAPSRAPAAAETPLPAGGRFPGEVESLMSLTVSTYSGGDPRHDGSGRLSVRTRVSLTGDVTVQVGDQADPRLLELHEKTVGQALRARLAYLRLLASGDG